MLVSKNYVEEILYQQLELLAEESKNAKRNERGYKPGLTEYTNAMCQISAELTILLRMKE